MPSQNFSMMYESKYDLIGERNRLREENERLRSIYPRVFKLIDKEKFFLVVAEDDPYFGKVYSMIRDQEIKIGRWNENDEETYLHYVSSKER